MNVKKIVVLLIIALITISVFGKVKTIQVKSKNLKTQKLKLEKTVTFDEDSPVSETFIIANDKIFFVNRQEKLLYICDLNGKEIKLIDSKGKGPGEFSMPTGIINDMKNNRIGVIDQMNRRISYFDYNGEHIIDENFQGMKIPMDISYTKNGRFYFYMGLEVGKGGVKSKPTIELIKKDTVVTIYSDSFNPLNMNIGKSKIPVYAVSKDRIYIAPFTSEKYEIKVYDENGNQLFTLIKNAKKVKRSQEEIEEIENRLAQVKKRIKAAGSKISMKFSDYQYSPFISKLLTDTDKNLWVLTIGENGYYFDVINKSGKIIKKVKAGDGKSTFFEIYKDKLYELKGDEDKGFVLNIYDIKK